MDGRRLLVLCGGAFLASCHVTSAAHAVASVDVDVVGVLQENDDGVPWDGVASGSWAVAENSDEFDEEIDSPVALDEYSAAQAFVSGACAVAATQPRYVAG